MGAAVRRGWKSAGRRGESAPLPARLAPV